MMLRLWALKGYFFRLNDGVSFEGVEAGKGLC